MRTNRFSRQNQRRPRRTKRFRPGLERCESRAVLAASEMFLLEPLPVELPENKSLQAAVLPGVAAVVPAYADSNGAAVTSAAVTSAELGVDALTGSAPADDALANVMLAGHDEAAAGQSFSMLTEPTLRLSAPESMPGLMSDWMPVSIHWLHRAALQTRVLGLTMISATGEMSAAGDAAAEGLLVSTGESLVLALVRGIDAASGSQARDSAGVPMTMASGGSELMAEGEASGRSGGASARAIDMRQYASLMALSHSGHTSGPVVMAASDSLSAASHHGESQAASAVVAAASHSEHAAGIAPAFATAALLVPGDGEMSAWDRRDASGQGAAQAGLAHHGGGLAAKGGGSVELAKKWCTTTPLANRLVTTLEGKPTCDCKETPSKEGLAKYLPAGASGPVAFAAAATGAIAGWNAWTDGSCRFSDADAKDTILGWSADHICSTRPVDQAIASLANALRSSRTRTGEAASAAGATASTATASTATASTATGLAAANPDGGSESAELSDRASEAFSADHLNWLGAGLIVAGVYLAPWVMRRQETEADRRAAAEAARQRWQVEVL